MKLTTFAIMLLGATVMTTGAWAKTAISTPSTMQQQHAQKSIAQIEALLKQKDIPFERVIASPYANMSGIYQVIYKDDVAYIDATGQYFIVGDVFEKNDLIKQAGGQLPAFEHQNTLPKSNLSYAKFSGELVYISPAQNYLWTGTLIRVDDMADLTDELTMEVNRVAWDSLPLQNAMKEVKGNGQRKMVVFSDPHCPYCKRLEQTLQQLDNVTIYTFLYPLKSNSMATSQQIWCDSQPVQAWKNWMLHNRQPTVKGTCSTPLQANLDLGTALNVSGTPSMIFENGYLLIGAQPLESIEKMLEMSAK